MTAEIIEPGFHGSNLIRALEDALERVKKGDIVASILIGVTRDGEYTVSYCSGDIDRIPILTMIGELEYRKQQLIELVE